MTKNQTPKILTIAGSDSLAGGGLQADLATFNEYGLFGLTAITSIATITTTDFKVFPVDTDVLATQLDSIRLVDQLAAVKVGLLVNLDQVKLVSDFLKQLDLPIVIDPVLAVKEGDYQQQEAFIDFYRINLLPLADIITPNLSEAQLLTDVKNINSREDLIAVNQQLQALGIANVFTKGGQRLAGEMALDLWSSPQGNHFFEKPKLDLLTDINGSGCTLSAAVAAGLAQGLSMEEALRSAKDFVWAAINHSVNLGDQLDGNSVWPAGQRLVNKTQ
ncbi:hydroxymethylpyrimidine/phosphomethylpyrimidine kinase [Convivina praedatoris]|uniref:pyridoxal kinase n=1 Tax=Convivina praedatoris TaxID=2880963 RepID=A0ABM9D1P4_9LACO|nr:hydroxymethylpyrimidine/phosphomethylpyrimidine kinase [Convivina sp. LMG 32447]CAH1852049.1 Pyridoxine kinase [Convivina sp. LMG 32447]CAH1853923.1 Pyridoxine kinase [Convivina sp. LMG 32447]CAH1854142.1 Pyridoxine kinase [Convivina sp. LMG 32447]